MRPTFHQTAFAIVNTVAARSTCSRRSVGCVVVDSDNRILGTGHNGVAAGMPHCIEIPCPGAKDKSGDNRRCEAIHAEANCISNMTDRRFATTMYCSCTPCFDCCKLVLTTNIKRIIVQTEYTDGTGISMLKAARVRLYRWLPMFDANPEMLIEL